MACVAFLGLGAMGSRMVARLIDAGHEVTVWNRSAVKAEGLVERGARLAASPRDAVAGADFALSMVRDDDASRTVWLDSETGALAGMDRNALAIECSTLSLGWTRELASAAEAAGLAFADAPLAGSRPQAEAGTLIFFVGGEVAAVERARPLLSALGAGVHHAGRAGAGMSIKLAVNALLGVQVALMAELLEGLRRQGLEPAQALEIIAATPVCAPAAKIAGEMMLKGAFAPLFPIELVEKDLGYQAEVSGGGGPITLAAREVYQRAAMAGLGGEHLSGVVKLYRQ